METITSSPIWEQANDAGILRIRLYEGGWESQPFITHILPIWTRPKHNFFLACHLQFAGYAAYPISPPIVPKGKDRVRLVFHAANTDAEVEALAACICTWAKEMLEIESADDDVRLPTAARKAYALMAKAGLNPA